MSIERIIKDLKKFKRERKALQDDFDNVYMNLVVLYDVIQFEIKEKKEHPFKKECVAMAEKAIDRNMFILLQ